MIGESDFSELECQFCFSHSVKRQEDGSYVCTNCHSVQTIQDTYDDIDNYSGQVNAIHSYHISQSQKSEEFEPKNVVLAESIRLVLAFQTAAVENLLHVNLSNVVFYYLQKFEHLLRPPITKNTWRYSLLILLASVNHLGFPITPLDLVNWVRDGLVPYYLPMKFLPQSFTERLEKEYGKILKPPFLDVDFLIQDKYLIDSTSMLPLPNPKLTFWKIANLIGVPAEPFVSFCLFLAKEMNGISMEKAMNPERILYSMEWFLNYGYGIPLGISIFALTLIYRLDGTDWIHPSFLKLDFPPFTEVIENISKHSSIHPSFPKIKSKLPNLLFDMKNLLKKESEPLKIESKCIINDVSLGFGTDVRIPVYQKVIGNFNNDIQALIFGFARIFGISEQSIMKQYSILLNHNYGKKYIKKKKLEEFEFDENNIYI